MQRVHWSYPSGLPPILARSAAIWVGRNVRAVQDQVPIRSVVQGKCSRTAAFFPVPFGSFGDHSGQLASVYLQSRFCDRSLASRHAAIYCLSLSELDGATVRGGVALFHNDPRLVRHLRRLGPHWYHRC
jgi:hypothetical protein